MKIKEICDQIRGVSYSPKNIYDKLNDDSITLLRATNIQNGLLLNDLVYIQREIVSDKQKLRKGDILICTSSGSKHLVGKAVHIDKNLDMTFGAFCKVVRPKNVCPEYLAQFFQSPVYRKIIANSSVGVNINNIKTEDIDNIEINLPSVPEQERIAKELDVVCGAMEKQKKQLELCDTLIKSKFNEMFGDTITNDKGWEINAIGSVSKLEGGYAFSSKDYTKTGIKIIKITNVSKDILDWTDVDYVSKELGEKCKRFFIKEGDVLMAMTRPIIKSLEAVKIAKAKKEDLPALVNQRVGKFVIDKSKILSTYLMEFCKLSKFKSQIEKFSSNSLQPNVSSAQVESIKIPLPPLPLQQQFADFVNEVEQNKAKIKQSLNETETLYKALMQKYFDKGEV